MEPNVVLTWQVTSWLMMTMLLRPYWTASCSCLGDKHVLDSLTLLPQMILVDLLLSFQVESTMNVQHVSLSWNL